MKVKSRRLASLFHPASIFRPVYVRKQNKSASSNPLGLEVRFARNRSEIEQALRLAYELYVSKGLMQPNDSGLRLLPQHALPTTNIIIALQKRKVVGTLTLIRDGAFGLPMDSIYDIAHLRTPPHRVAEISSLAVHKNYRTRQSTVLIPLLKFLYQSASRYLGVSILTIAINPSHLTFYLKVLGFRRISDQDVPKYDFVNGAPAIGLYLFVPENREGLTELCRFKKGSERVLGRFLDEDRCFSFPNQPFYSITHPIMTKEIFQYFFQKKTNLLSNLHPKQTQYLETLYLGRPKTEAYRTPQVYPRFDVKCPTVIESETTANSTAIAQNVSHSGIGLYSETPIPSGSTLRLKIQTGKDSTSMVKATAVWSKENGMHGLKITEAPPEWNSFVDYLSNEAIAS